MSNTSSQLYSYLFQVHSSRGCKFDCRVTCKGNGHCRCIPTCRNLRFGPHRWECGISADNSAGGIHHIYKEESCEIPWNLSSTLDGCLCPTKHVIVL